MFPCSIRRDDAAATEILAWLDAWLATHEPYHGIQGASDETGRRSEAINEEFLAGLRKNSCQ